MKKRLLIFHPYLAPYRIDLYNEFCRDFETEVLLTGARAELDTLGFNLESVNSRAVFKYEYFSDARYLGRHPVSTVFWKKIRQFKPDIVLAHEYGLNTLAAILARPFFGYKLFLTCDDSPHMAERYSRTRKMLRDYVVRHASGILCVNPDVVDYLKLRYRGFGCKFLYFPIIQNDTILSYKIDNSSDTAGEHIRKFSLDEKKVLLFVGRLIYNKHVDLIIDAFKEICREEYRLVIVGGGELENDLKGRVSSYGLDKNVIFTGALDGNDLYAWYHLADLFVLASRQEPFGAVVNEALVAGCRSIVSNRCGSSALITSGNGHVFESDNLLQLSRLIQEEFSALPESKKHINLMSKKFEDFYNELAKLFQA